jgi:hypothetical protein
VPRLQQVRCPAPPARNWSAVAVAVAVAVAQQIQRHIGSGYGSMAPAGTQAAAEVLVRLHATS